MIKIEKKALDYAKENDGIFVVKTLSASGGCCDVPVKDICIEFLKEFKSSKNYHSFVYDDVEVFVEKGLDLADEVLIYQKAKLPFIGTIFGTKGISVRYF